MFIYGINHNIAHGDMIKISVHYPVSGAIKYKRLLNQNKYERATAYPTKMGFVKDVFTYKFNDIVL